MLRLGGSKKLDCAEEVSAKSKRARGHPVSEGGAGAAVGQDAGGGSLCTKHQLVLPNAKARSSWTSALALQLVYELIALCLASQLPVSILFMFLGVSSWGQG